MKKVNVIHENAPFKVLNCAQYHNNPELLSGILFGYVKGAFTGADEDRNGLLQDADGGVLFLDEVHRLPPEGQEKLFVYMWMAELILESVKLSITPPMYV